LLKSMVLWHGC